MRGDFTTSTTTPAAIAYAIRELGRRAGATPQFIARWRIERSAGAVTLYVKPGSDARIVFPFDANKPQRFHRLRDAGCTRHGWMRRPLPSVAHAAPDFIVPFDAPRAAFGAPLFARIAPGRIECAADIVTATLWMLSRAEELDGSRLDQHGRFPANASVAVREAFLDRPVIDEYGLALAQALECLLPSWRPSLRPLRAKLSHDVDQVGLPRRWQTTLGHLYPREIPRAFARDVLAALGNGVPAYLQAIVDLATQSRRRGLDSAFYWQAADGGTPWETGYALDDRDVAAVLERLRIGGFEIGIHPTYGAFDSEETLKREVLRMRAVVGARPMGGRQHYLRWNPSTWRSWERAGLAYDSSVGFADAIGFRAGTALPYHPWLLDEQRESRLLEIPLIVMDCTPVAYMHLDPEQSLAAIATLVRRCRTVGGVFTLLWHNDRSLYAPYSWIYPRILDLLAGCDAYDWHDDLPLAPLPQAGVIPSAVVGSAASVSGPAPATRPQDVRDRGSGFPSPT